MEKRIRFTIILVLILIVVIAFSFQSKEKKEYLVYNEALDKTAVTVDDVSLTLKDIAFYVAYEEKTVQEQAILYNPEQSKTVLECLYRRAVCEAYCKTGSIGYGCA